jgi:DNA polymerase elongation subunit (family B)
LSKILIIDIETAPNIAYVWGAWKQNIGQNQWKEKSHIMSYAAKWLGEDEILYEENRKADDRQIVKSMFRLLDMADVVVAHNGERFDLPVILGRGVVHGLTPPSPYFIVDTLRVARKEFRFVTNRLVNIAEELGVSPKDDHKKFPGFELWLECLRGNEEAWDEMRKYNVQDVLTLEEVYLRLRPYMRNHPNIAHRQRDGVDTMCPKCGSSDIQYRGWYFTKMGLAYRKFVCKSCGGWGRDRNSDKDILVTNGRNAV